MRAAKLALATVVIAISGCIDARTELPWLSGLQDIKTATSTRSHADAEEGCASGTLAEYELSVDVARAPGVETIRASFRRGLEVYDAEERLIASSPGYDCEGSADEVVALAAGAAFGKPTIAFAVRRGGHREDATLLVLFRIGDNRRLDVVFSGEVEQRDGDTRREGTVWLLPTGFIYGPPSAAMVLD